MVHKLTYKIAAVTSAIVMALGFALTLGSAPAMAASGNQWCTDTAGSCLNAWNGGPFVNVYRSRGAANNDFQMVNVSGSVWELKFVGPGAWNGRCIGDAYNDPNNPDTSLDNCPTSGGSAGWGTNLTREACAGGYRFKSNHDGLWLEPVSDNNGAHFIFSAPYEYSQCFVMYSPA